MSHFRQRVLREHEILICKSCALKLVPPHLHQRNVADVSIKAFKQHFLSITAGLVTKFPMYQWEHLQPQAKLTLNIIR